MRMGKTSYLINDTIGKEKFIRGCYVELYSAEDVGSEIDGVVLPEPVVETAIATRQNIVANAEYTAMERYDDTESVFVEEIYYDSYGQRRSREIERRETKERTRSIKETDEDLKFSHVEIQSGEDMYWNTRGDRAQWLFESRHFLPAEGDRARVLKEIDCFDREDLCKNALETKGKQRIQARNPRIYGVNIKWEVLQSSVDILSLDSYHTQFQYKGQTCYIAEFATENVCTRTREEWKPAPISKEQIERRAALLRRRDERKVYATNPIKFVFKFIKDNLPWALLAVSVLLLLIGGIIGALWGILGVPMLMVGAYMLSKKMYGNIPVEKELEERAKASLIEDQQKPIRGAQKEKIALLNARFAKMGQPSLTQRELERFELENRHFLCDVVCSYRK